MDHPEEKGNAPRMGSGGPAMTALQVDAERKVERERAVRRETTAASIVKCVAK